jgi:tRNA(fMet)-specific endonuclease VapC
MEAVVLDTDVFSFFFKEDTRARPYEADIRGRQLCLSFQTIAEVKAWAIVRNWGIRRRRALDNVLARYLVLPYDSRMVDAWAMATASRMRIGQPIECGDAWIAAAALRHDIALLTHNARHYRDIPGLKLVTHPDAKP